MYSFVRLRVISLISLALGFGLAPINSQSGPTLRNLNLTSGGENSVSLLTADVNNGGGGVMTLHVNWGDGTPVETYSYPAATTNITDRWHYYEDDNPTATAGDVYTMSLSLSNNTGAFATDLTVVVTNVPPRLTLKVNSPIEIGAPATLRGLAIKEFPLPSAGGFPQGIAAGPDGNIWFTETASNRVGRITTNGVITEFPIGGGASELIGIAAGADNRLWFCAYGSGQIGAITTNGVRQMYTIPRTAGEPVKLPQYITRGGGSNMWYTDLGYRIGRITPTGIITQFVYQSGWNPYGIALGFDNNIWFTDYFNDAVRRLRLSDNVTTSFPLAPLATPALMTRGSDNALWFTQLQSGNVGRIASNGALTETNFARSLPHGITTGPDGAIWYTEKRSNSIARLTLDGKFSRYDLAVFSDPREIVAGPDGALWFTISQRDRIGRIRFTTFGNVLLSGSLNDPGYLDPHTVQIDWGDGSAVETLNLEAGIASFHVTHVYSGSQPSYQINVTATDDDAGISDASTTVLVNGVIQFTSITRSPVGEVRLKGVGGNGRIITIEASNDLKDWSSVGTANSVNNNFEFVHASPAATRFYRGKL